MKRTTQIAVAAAAAFSFLLIQDAHAASKMPKMSSSKIVHGRYGGIGYGGAPALTATSSMVTAGGGPGKFSTAKLLTSMIGVKAVAGEVTKLSKQYGAARVKQFIAVNDFSVGDALKIATKAGVKLPQPMLSGVALAKTLVMAGMEKDGTFNTELLLDKAVSHDIHEQVMDDINKKFGPKADADYHRISNQAHYDLGKAIGVKGIKLASFH